MERYLEVMVALTESVIKNRLKRILAEDGRLRHIWLAIKPHYLANHASQIKSYYGTLLGSPDHSYRIRHGKSPETPPGSKITMTSYPACNKTSLSRKPCIRDKNLLWTLWGSHGRSFRIRHEISHETPPGGGLTMTSCPIGNKTCISETMYRR